MSIVTLNNGKTEQIPDRELSDYLQETGLKVVCYHSTSPATYKYEFSDGTVGTFTKKGARVYSFIHGIKITNGGPLGYSTGDLYAGYNPALGKNISGKSEYKRLCKERGLIEVGNEKVYHDAIKPDSDFKYSDSDIKTLVDNGADISGREAKALIDGSL